MDGGIEVSGRWQWGSGITHCTTIGGGCVVQASNGGRPSAQFTFFDRADVEILDTWYVAGLKGTGSTDYEVHDAFVPNGRWFSLAGAVPVEDGPLYRFSFFGLLALGVASVALGLARRSIDELVDLAATKRPQGSSKPLAERAPVQADVAIAEAELGSARAFMADVVGAAWSTVESGDRATDEQRRSIRLAATHAMDREWPRGRSDVHSSRWCSGLRRQPDAARVPRRPRRHAARHHVASHVRARRSAAPGPRHRRRATVTRNRDGATVTVQL